MRASAPASQRITGSFQTSGSCLARPGRDDLKVPADDSNVTKRIDTLLVNPLHQLPLGSFGGSNATIRTTGRELNLAFRNLTRAWHGPALQRPAAGRTLRPLAAGCWPDPDRERRSIPRRPRRRPEEVVRAGHSPVVLRPAGGRAQRRAADRRRRPDRGRGLPPRLRDGTHDKNGRPQHQEDPQKYKGDNAGSYEYRNDSHRDYLHLPVQCTPICFRVDPPVKLTPGTFGLFRRG